MARSSPPAALKKTSKKKATPAPRGIAKTALRKPVVFQSKYKIEFWTGSGPQPFFARLCSAKNGQTIAPSEGYATKAKRTKTWGGLAEDLRCEIVNVPAPPEGEKIVARLVPTPAVPAVDLGDDLTAADDEIVSESADEDIADDEADPAIDD